MNSDANVFDLGDLETEPKQPRPLRPQTMSPVTPVSASWPISLSLFVPGGGHLFGGEAAKGLAMLASIAFLVTSGWAIVSNLDRLAPTLELLGLPAHAGVWALGALYVPDRARSRGRRGRRRAESFGFSHGEAPCRDRHRVRPGPRLGAGPPGSLLERGSVSLGTLAGRLGLDPGHARSAGAPRRAESLLASLAGVVRFDAGSLDLAGSHLGRGGLRREPPGRAPDLTS